MLVAEQDPEALSYPVSTLFAGAEWRNWGWGGHERSWGRQWGCTQSSGILIYQPAQSISTFDNGHTGVNGLTSAAGRAQGQCAINICGAELKASMDMLGF